MDYNVYIALGSNMGDRLGNMGSAILHLSQHPDVEVRALSSVYETAPVGYVDQEAFYNMVIQVSTTIDPIPMMHLCLEIEQRLGRVRTIANGPRTIDLDLIYYADRVIEVPDVILPHPRLQDRAFVLVPLVEIAPNFVHPILKRENSKLLELLSLECVTKLDFFIRN